jgi:hypothetical protein
MFGTLKLATFEAILASFTPSTSVTATFERGQDNRIGLEFCEHVKNRSRFLK